MKLRALPLVSVLALLLAGCAGDDFHLAGKSADGADIVLDGPRGTVSWHWGPKAYSQPFTLEKKNVSHSPAGWRGTMDLKLSGGRHLALTGEHGTFVCEKGCDDLHLPLLWTVADK
ncbi:MAG TPA: hypothetical protein VM621_14170 [Luteibacter sp.]|uniref:hypothetical protein n=1 Tax=Luteibacter sp. TaxID=1886636 RepID=UPI002BCDDCCF|nr:hypothetical protein [Luteibacter sp.]HVI56184.1 hypothetical protein [Luteibacter sp.]